MGQLIEFYVPATFIYPRQKWIPESERGKVLAFRAPSGQKKSA